MAIYLRGNTWWADYRDGKVDKYTAAAGVDAFIAAGKFGWSGGGLQYLADRYMSHTTQAVHVPAGVGDVSALPRVVYTQQTYLDTVAGWRIGYPTGWEVKGPTTGSNSQTMTFSRPLAQEPSFFARVSVIRYEGFGLRFDLQSWSRANLEGLAESGAYRLISSYPIKVGRSEAIQVIYRDTYTTTEVQAIRLHILNYSDAYVIVGLTTLDSWDKAGEILVQLVRSFRP